jgi:hypothetical protein
MAGAAHASDPEDRYDLRAMCRSDIKYLWSDMPFLEPHVRQLVEEYTMGFGVSDTAMRRERLIAAIREHLSPDSEHFDAIVAIIKGEKPAHR